MTVNHKPTGRAVPVWKGLCYGAAAAIGVTILTALAATKLIEKEILSWDHSGYAVMAALIVSAWWGAMVAAGKIKRQRMVMCLLSGGIYFILLLMAATLFFGAQYSGVGETALLIFCGSTLGALCGFQVKNKRKPRKNY